jgi:hypothetical protein
MDRLREVGLLVCAALACDVVAREAEPAAVMAMAPATAEAKAAKKQARAEKAGKQAGKIGREKPNKAGGKKAGKKAENGAKEAREVNAGKHARPSLPSPEAPGGPPLPPCPPDDVLTWRSFGAGFLLTWCTGCHSSSLPEEARQGAPLATDFDTYALYKPFERLVYERAVTEAHAFAEDPEAAASPMPPAGLVPEADRKRLAQWIACGSPGAPQ